jgi:hypothetical protein
LLADKKKKETGVDWVSCESKWPGHDESGLFGFVVLGWSTPVVFHDDLSPGGKERTGNRKYNAGELEKISPNPE